MDDLRAFGGPLHLQLVAPGSDRNPVRVELDSDRRRIWVYTARTVVVSDVAWRVFAPRDVSDAEVTALISQWIGEREQPSECTGSP